MSSRKRPAARRTRIGLMVERSAESGYRILLGIVRYFQPFSRHDLHRLPTEDDALEAAIAALECEGVIMEANNARRHAIARRVTVPVVNVSTRRDTPGVASVTADDRAIGAMAAEHLLGRGFRHFAFFGMATAFSLNRRTGFHETVARTGCSCAFAPTQVEDNPTDHLVPWLATLRKPLGVFACNDHRGWRVIMYAHQAGLRIPEELAVVGCDNDPYDCEVSEVPLSSVDPGFEHVGYRAAETLNRLMQSGLPPPESIRVPPVRVVIRRSSDVFAVRDTGVVRTLRYIQGHAAEAISVRDVARAVSVSRRSLERRYRAALGRTPGDDLRQTRTAIAKELLIETDLPMPLVAEKSGFSDAKVFGMAFRSQAGMAPSAFRAQFRSA